MSAVSRVTFSDHQTDPNGPADSTFEGVTSSYLLRVRSLSTDHQVGPHDLTQ